jgi:CheY-like chemotaxis protein
LIIRLSFQLSLESKGHQVFVAYNGLEGLQILHSLDFQIDVVLLDLQMPIMDGFTTVRLIREAEVRRRGFTFPLLIIAMSAGSDEETLAEVRLSSFDAFLAKPFRFDAFERIVRDHSKPSS